MIQPGCGYNRDMPVRYFTAEQPVINGADVLQVNCAYDANPDYAAADVATRETWVTADVIAAYNAAAGQRPYKWITVVAKSLGTRALARLPASCPSPRPWTVRYTSIFSDPNVARELRGLESPSLVAVGTGDPYHDAAALGAASWLPGTTTLAIEAAGHALEPLGDIVKSVRVLAGALESLRRFFRSDRLHSPRHSLTAVRWARGGPEARGGPFTALRAPLTPSRLGRRAREPRRNFAADSPRRGARRPRATAQHPTLLHSIRQQLGDHAWGEEC